MTQRVNERFARYSRPEQAKIERLPRWAQDHIENCEREVAQLEAQFARLTDEVEGTRFCAACLDDDPHGINPLAVAGARIRELEAENTDLRRIVNKLHAERWGWSRGVVPIANPDACGGCFFSVRPADVEEFIKDRYRAYHGYSLREAFGFRVDEHGSLRVRLLGSTDWRSSRGLPR